MRCRRCVEIVSGPQILTRGLGGRVGGFGVASGSTWAMGVVRQAMTSSSGPTTSPITGGSRFWREVGGRARGAGEAAAVVVRKEVGC